MAPQRCRGRFQFIQGGGNAMSTSSNFTAYNSCSVVQRSRSSLLTQLRDNFQLWDLQENHRISSRVAWGPRSDSLHVLGDWSRLVHVVARQGGRRPRMPAHRSGSPYCLFVAMQVSTQANARTDRVVRPMDPERHARP